MVVQLINVVVDVGVVQVQVGYQFVYCQLFVVYDGDQVLFVVLFVCLQ